MSKTVIIIEGLIIIVAMVIFLIWSSHHCLLCKPGSSSYNLEQSDVNNLWLYGRDITKEISLSRAIEDFNKKCPDKNPLTQQEVIAAIRNWNRKEDPVSDTVYAIYNRVVEQQVLPKGMYFSNITKYIGLDYTYEVGWKDLVFRSPPEDQSDPDIGLGYTYRIRARYISSRPITNEERLEAMQLSQ